MPAHLSLRADGTAEILVAFKAAWHNQGKTVDHLFNSEEAISEIFPYNIFKLALYAHSVPGSPQENLAALWGSKFLKSNQTAIVRGDTGAIIGEVGATNELLQPRKMFGWVDTIIEGSGYHYATAGALKGGSVMFLTAAVGEINILGSGDVSKTFLAFVNSYDGSLCAQAYMTVTRIVCDNTLQLSLGNAENVLKFRHTKGMHNKMAQASGLVQHVKQTEEGIKSKLETLAKRPIKSKETYGKILDSLFPGDSTRTENIKRDVTVLWQDNDNNKWPEWKGTAYGLVNAVSRYTDHMRSVRGDDKEAARAESAIIGEGAKLKAKALDVIMRLTDGTETAQRTYSLPSERAGGLLDSVIEASG